MIATNVLVTIITVKCVEILDYQSIMLVTMIAAKWVVSNDFHNMLFTLITAKWVNINDYHKTCWLH